MAERAAWYKFRSVPLLTGMDTAAIAGQAMSAALGGAVPLSAPPPPGAPPPPQASQGAPPPPPPPDVAAALGQLTALTGATGAKGGGKRKRDGEDGLMAEDSVMGRIQEYGLKAGPGNSVIWDYFEKYNVANDSPLRSIGVCKLCRQQDDYAKVRCLCAGGRTRTRCVGGRARGRHRRVRRRLTAVGSAALEPGSGHPRAPPRPGQGQELRAREC